MPTNIDRMHAHSNRSDLVWKTLTYAILIFTTVVALFPFYWILITAVKPLQEIFEYPPRLWPSSFICRSEERRVGKHF